MASNNLTFEQQVIELTNLERTKKGLQPLKANAELNYVADKYAQDMFNGNFFSHTAPDGSKPWDRLKTIGYEARTVGENIAKGQRTPQQVLQGWMNSSGHRANILNPNFTEIGTGFDNNLWVQNFGSGDRNPISRIPSSSQIASNSPSKSVVPTTQSVMGYIASDDFVYEPNQESSSDMDSQKSDWLLNGGLDSLPSEGDGRLNDSIVSQVENVGLIEQFVLDNRQIIGSNRPFETPPGFAANDFLIGNQNTENWFPQIEQVNLV
ncbi:hypothetical protein WA1_03120 [Scytonema hofmannii PCC 7110]|uniref:SCP domain-containing protein n=1 Tax=Scytonema hofmannii PCC 7110 TaxID=128403 RepID=A0A139XHP2_9CYAN|nr:CAP domain-containing protein [Scytonema hofmannii]KYC44142.1 hypothetical protein WA1_03120 [Scytonema hofmannii PCC 7110]